jgi:beta-mannosidase
VEVVVMRIALNDWQFRRVGAGVWRPAKVPGCVHADLMRCGEIPDPFWADNEQKVQWVEEEDWEYRCHFSHVESDTRKRFLVAEGLDTSVTVFLNGRLLARADNMFVRHRWRVDRHLVTGRNELILRFESPMKYIRRVRRSHRPFDHQDWVGGCTRIRKQQSSFGWDWGPRLATSGIWLPIYLESGEPGIGDFRVTQNFRGRDALVGLQFAGRPSGDVRAVLSRNGETVAGGAWDGVLKVRDAALWWPNGEGEQPLYDLRLERWDGGRVTAVEERRIGLRTVRLQQKPDARGETFEFVVNGRRIFAKGANWIPAHAFVAGLERSDYEPLLQSAVDANMNMLRVWGGGIYEHGCFYDLCDELGLLVWQDFMFACTLYPGDAQFLRSVRKEAVQQVRRLRNHACLALWCGNNEIEILPQNKALLESDVRYRRAYDAIFGNILPGVVAEECPAIFYHRSSPLGSQNCGVPHSERRQWGDAHNWDVFHSKAPLETYEKSAHRFVSEFGMQAFVTPEVAATFCDRSDFSITSEPMENHQKHPCGNEVILDYVLRRYRFPRDYASLAYLSQLNQAEAMRMAIEHFRRDAPHTMGALYWQFNDCWPAASWSGLEFGGRWRALHYELRRLFALILLCPKMSGRVVRGQGNQLLKETGKVDLWMACDAADGTAGDLEWSVLDWEGKVRLSGTARVRLRHLESLSFGRLDFRELLAGELPPEQCYFRCRYLPKTGASLEVVRFFLAPRYLALPKVVPEWRIQVVSKTFATVEVSAPAFLHAVAIEGFPGIGRITDNFFDLEKGAKKTVGLELKKPMSGVWLKRHLRLRSMVDS